jgi:hypothetical protein
MTAKDASEASEFDLSSSDSDCVCPLLDCVACAVGKDVPTKASEFAHPDGQRHVIKKGEIDWRRCQKRVVFRNSSCVVWSCLH